MDRSEVSLKMDRSEMSLKMTNPLQPHFFLTGPIRRASGRTPELDDATGAGMDKTSVIGDDANTASVARCPTCEANDTNGDGECPILSSESPSDECSSSELLSGALNTSSRPVFNAHPRPKHIHRLVVVIL